MGAEKIDDMPASKKKIKVANRIYLRDKKIKTRILFIFNNGDSNIEATFS